MNEKIDTSPKGEGETTDLPPQAEEDIRALLAEKLNPKIFLEELIIIFSKYGFRTFIPLLMSLLSIINACVPENTQEIGPKRLPTPSLNEKNRAKMLKNVAFNQFNKGFIKFLSSDANLSTEQSENLKTLLNEKKTDMANDIRFLDLLSLYSLRLQREAMHKGEPQADIVSKIKFYIAKGLKKNGDDGRQRFFGSPEGYYKTFLDNQSVAKDIDLPEEFKKSVFTQVPGFENFVRKWVSELKNLKTNIADSLNYGGRKTFSFLPKIIEKQIPLEEIFSGDEYEKLRSHVESILKTFIIYKREEVKRHENRIRYAENNKLGEEEVTKRGEEYATALNEWRQAMRYIYEFNQKKKIVKIGDSSWYEFFMPDSIDIKDSENIINYFDPIGGHIMSKINGYQDWQKTNPNKDMMEITAEWNDLQIIDDVLRISSWLKKVTKGNQNYNNITIEEKIIIRHLIETLLQNDAEINKKDIKDLLDLLKIPIKKGSIIEEFLEDSNK